MGIEILKNNKIKIKEEAMNANSSHDIVIVDASELSRDCIAGWSIVDVTNNLNATKDLILRTNDDNVMNIFDALRYHLFDYLNEQMYDIEEGTDDWNHKFIASLLSTFVCQFLYESDYNYRIECVFEDGMHLFMDQVWTYDIYTTFAEIQDGKETLDLQWFGGTGYTCDICRCEASRYEFMYHCLADDNHGFCVSCIYSMILQHDEMKSFINECLDNLLNADCIEEIVAFCLGKVRKF